MARCVVLEGAWEASAILYLLIIIMQKICAPQKCSAQVFPGAHFLPPGALFCSGALFFAGIMPGKLLTARKILNNSLTSLNANPIIFIKYHLHAAPNISAKHFHQQHLSTMAHTKRQVTKDGTVIPSPQSPRPPSPSRFTVTAIALHSTTARVAAVATSALTSPSKTTDIGVRLRAALHWCLSHQYFRDSLDILREWGGSANPTVASVN